MVAVDDDRELRLVEQVEVRRLAHRVGEQPREAQVVLDRSHHGVGPVGEERHPRAEPTERVRHLDALPDGPDRPRIGPVADVLEVRRLVGEGGVEHAAVTQQDAADRLREVEPLVRIDRDRVRPLEPAEEVGGARGRGRGSAIGSVDVHPDAVLGADVGERVERVDRAGAGRAGDAHDRDGGHAGGAVALDGARELVGADAERVVAADHAQGAPAEAEDVARARDRVVRLTGGVDRGRPGRHAVLARRGQCTRTRARQPGQVGERSAAREVADPGREADQLGQPAPGDVLHLRGRPGAAAEIGVERRREHGRRRCPPRAPSRR